MFWIPLVMAGMSLLNSQKQNAAIKQQNKVNKTNTAIANLEQQSNSTLAAAQGALSRATQSIQTKEAQRQYGEQWNSLEEQRAKIGEQMTKGTFRNRINASAQLGALQASASAAGVGGSTVDMLSSTMELQSAVQEEELQQVYSDNLYSLEREKQENLYGQYGILQQQDVYLDNVAAATIVGPAKIPTISAGTQLMEAGMTFLQSYSQTSDGNAFFKNAQNKAGNTLKSWFSSGANKGA